MSSRPSELPEKVMRAIVDYNLQHPTANISLDELVWDGLNCCYFFVRAEMYHGVELDGYIHT